MSRLPDDDAFADDVRGKKFTVVMERYRDTLRNAVAHVGFDRERLRLTHHKLQDLDRVRMALPAMRFVARVGLLEEIRIFDHACKAAGGVVHIPPPPEPPSDET